MTSLSQITRDGKKAKLNGNVWFVQRSSTPGKTRLCRLVNVKGRLELGGYSADHVRWVTIERDQDCLAEAV